MQPRILEGLRKPGSQRRGRHLDSGDGFAPSSWMHMPVEDMCSVCALSLAENGEGERQQGGRV